jgi:hypothetical protein
MLIIRDQADILSLSELLPFCPAAPMPKIDEKLHPSWQASKKRKMENTIHAFQGKKMTFDDDD